MYIAARLYHRGIESKVQHPLKNAEFTFYTSPQCTTIAKDINNNDCVGLTDNNGKVSFEVNTNQNTIYYVKVTRMPFGYKAINAITTVRPCDFNPDASSAVITQVMFDTIVVIPPKIYDFGLRSKIDPNIIIASYYYQIGSGSSKTTWYYGIGKDIDGNPWRVDEYKLIYPNSSVVYTWCDEGTQHRVEDGRIVTGQISQPWAGYPYFDQMFGAIINVVHYYEQHVG